MDSSARWGPLAAAKQKTSHARSGSVIKNWPYFAEVRTKAYQTASLVALELDSANSGSRRGTRNRTDGHERIHLTLKREATKPAAANVLQEQARFDDFSRRYNTDRPHQALGMKVPADVSVRSPRVYRGLQELTYPFHDHTIMVTRCGRI